MNIVGKVLLLKVILSHCIHSGFVKLSQFVRRNNNTSTDNLMLVNCGKQTNI